MDRRYPSIPLLWALLIGAAVPAPGTAEAAWTSDTVPSAEVLEARGAVIGEVTVITEDVFDPDRPDEKYKLYRIANRLHRSTHPEVVRRQLLFAEGDPYSRRLIAESERILRANRYLYDAEIRAVAYRNNRVDLEVRTRDVWTLRPGIALGRGGGANSSDFKLEDHNILGSGKSVTLKYATDVDRETLLFRYEDRQFLGRWMTLKLRYGDASDGGMRLFQLERPFYSLDTRWAAGAKFYDNNRVDSLYAQGEVVNQFRHRETLFELHAGFSRGLTGKRTWRWTTGITYDEDQFAPAVPLPIVPRDAGSVTDQLLPHKRPFPRPGWPGDPKSGTLLPTVPENRVLTYPWIGVETDSDDYEETHSLDQMGRTEDVKLGVRFQARLGYASRAFGGNLDAAVFDSRLSAGWRFTDRQRLLLSGVASGRWGKTGAEDVRLSARARYYWRDFGRHLFFIHLEADAIHEPDGDRQLLLGGDSGLRGYPLRYQDGEQRALVSLEQRFFTDLYPFRLAYVGAAVFVDVGRTWGAGLADDLGTLKNVGVGLRLSSSRSGQGSVLHFDVAFPLDRDASIESVQWLVSSKSSF